MKKIILLLLACVFSMSLTARKTDSANQDPDEAAVKNTIESFLTAVGNYDTEAVSAMFTPKANISGASLKDGKWNYYIMTIEEFIASQKAVTNPKKYKEPVNNWTIQVDGGQLAFVRADATLFRDGKKQKHNIDYFTLIKTETGWKILNGSYVSTPIQEKAK